MVTTTATATDIPWYVLTVPTEFVYGRLMVGSFIKPICQEGWYLLVGFTKTHALLCKTSSELWNNSCLDDNVVAFFDATQLKMEGC